MNGRESMRNTRHKTQMIHKSVLLNDYVQCYDTIAELFELILYVPVNILSAMSGSVMVCTSNKQTFNVLLKDTTQCLRRGLIQRYIEHSSTEQLCSFEADALHNH